MKNFKTQKGITLIALVITIIVMMILVAVTVTVALRGGLFSAAKKAKDDTKAARDAELKLDSGKIKIGGQWYNTYQDYLDNNPIQTYLEIEPEAVALKAKESADIETEEEEVKTAKIKATRHGIDGNPEISWTATPADVVILSAETGDEITITVKEGITEDATVTLTASCTYEGETVPSIEPCTINVTIIKAPAEVQVGDYVRYNVTYKDVYSETMPKFTADNGWRYLGKDSDGNHLLVSTGIPAKLYYHYYDTDTIGNKADRTDGGGNDWWATTAQITALPTSSQYYTTSGYDHLVNNGEPIKYATYGMRYNFESIPFAKSDSAEENAGCYTEIDSAMAAVNGSVFRAPEYKDETKVQIRCLTLEDLNRATNAANGNNNRAETTEAPGFKEITGTDNVALGLFDMYALTDYGTSVKYYYFLASPIPGSVPGYYTSFTYGVAYDWERAYDTNFHVAGIRPVVVLSSDFSIVESEVEGVFKIEEQ